MYTSVPALAIFRRCEAVDREWGDILINYMRSVLFLIKFFVS